MKASSQRVAEVRPAFRFLRWICSVFTHRMEIIWEEPFDGQPAIFCPNHAGARGPIDMMTWFPQRDQLRPWFNEAVSDPKQMPAYVRQDYWWKPGCKLEPLYNATLPYIAAVLLPPIIRTVPGIPVYHDARILTTLRRSAKEVEAGRHLVIFPQMPSGWGEHCPGLLSGWLQVLPVIHRKTGIAMKLYPVRIDHPKHTIFVGKPVVYDPLIPLKDQQDAILKELASVMNV